MHATSQQLQQSRSQHKSAHLLVGWVVNVATCIAADNLADPLELLVAGLEAPEATTTLRCQMGARCSVRACQVCMQLHASRLQELVCLTSTASSCPAGTSVPSLAVAMALTDRLACGLLPYAPRIADTGGVLLMLRGVCRNSSRRHSVSL